MSGRLQKRLSGWQNLKTIKILLVDDHRIVRQGVRLLLAGERDMEVVAEADNGRDTIRLVQKLSPHVVIMDISMPDLNGIDATRQILSESPHVKVIALSMHSDGIFIFNMIRAGASGYLLKDCALEELVKAIRAVVANKTYLSPGVSDVLVQDMMGGWSARGAVGSASAFAVLTGREREVLQLMAEGKSTAQIANALSVSIKTVETHRKQIMHKSGVHTVAGLTKYAIREGLTSLEN